jgi:adenine-specific DNA-methyltransferase
MSGSEKKDADGARGVTAPERLDLRSADIAEEKRQELLRLFPSIRTEGGKIDFDRLKLALGERVDVGKERYGLTWPGKADCFRAIQTPSIGTLRPCPEESVNFDTTENLIIEGDNLEVLKLLQRSYLGKVKMIYIDPPYNTGNDFIYPDNYSESLQTYLEYTGQVDPQGKKFSTNPETDGRFHSKWLTMLYPRLYLARNLLREDGAVFISIDDQEFVNLRQVCNDIFGEENLVGVIVVQANKRGQTYKEIAKTHEYLLVYSRDEALELFELERTTGGLPYSDDRGPFDLWELRNRNPKFGRFNRPNLYFPIYAAPSTPDANGLHAVALTRDETYTIEVLPLDSQEKEGCWRWGSAKVAEAKVGTPAADVVARQTRDGKWNIYEKSRKDTTKVKSLWVDNDVISEQGTSQLRGLGLGDYFEHPKPVGLLARCIRVSMGKDDIALDFFAGSGTTAQAILELNREDGGRRQFMLVQLPEPTGRVEYSTIADITKERVRRVIKKLNDEGGQLGLEGGPKPDRGFRVFKLAESNIKAWDGNRDQDAKKLGEQLALHADHVRDDRTPQDILYEILLKSGFPLTTPFETLAISGKTVFAVAGGEMLVCLEQGLTLELIRGIAARPVGRVVCLDEGFAGNDQLKTNAVQIFKTKGIVFKTV